jgi:hypothetical protein
MLEATQPMMIDYIPHIFDENVVYYAFTKRFPITQLYPTKTHLKSYSVFPQIFMKTKVQRKT